MRRWAINIGPLDGCRKRYEPWIVWPVDAFSLLPTRPASRYSSDTRRSDEDTMAICRD